MALSGTFSRRFPHLYTDVRRTRGGCWSIAASRPLLRFREKVRAWIKSSCDRRFSTHIVRYVRPARNDDESSGHFLALRKRHRRRSAIALGSRSQPLLSCVRCDSHRNGCSGKEQGDIPWTPGALLAATGTRRCDVPRQFGGQEGRPCHMLCLGAEQSSPIWPW